MPVESNVRPKPTLSKEAIIDCLLQLKMMCLSDAEVFAEVFRKDGGIALRRTLVHNKEEWQAVMVDPSLEVGVGIFPVDDLEFDFPNNTLTNSIEGFGLNEYQESNNYEDPGHEFVYINLRRRDELRDWLVKHWFGAPMLAEADEIITALGHTTAALQTDWHDREMMVKVLICDQTILIPRQFLRVL